MKRTIVFLGMVCMATSALAFGGGGSGHDSTKYNRHNPGVDNFGVHIHPDNPPLDIRFYDIKDDANAQPCQEGANVYCCKEGYVVDVATSKCVACPAGSVATLDENFKCTVCEGEMIPNQDKSSCIMPEPTCEGPVCGENCCPKGTTCGENNECCMDGTCCPDGGTPIGSLCCKDGFKFDNENQANGYSLVDPEVCGCPDGGTPKDGVCCKNGVGFDYLTPENGYELYVPETCGCPFGGEVSSGVCCKNNFHIGVYQYYDSVNLNAPDSYYKTIDVAPCGCPNGGVSLHDEEHGWTEVCCYDGWSLRVGDEWEDKEFEPAVCGCPDGPDAEPGKLIGDTCCWRGMKYSIADLDYTDWDPQVCGCPEAEPPEGGTPLAYNEEYNQCCVNGYSYNSENGVYDMFSPDICGCPYKDYEGGMMNIELHDFVNCCSYQTNGIGLWNPSNGYYSGQEGYEEDTAGICP